MKYLTFSYDDGIVQDKKLVELFNKFGMKCTFNINSGNMSPESCWEMNGKHIRRMSVDEVQGLYDGHEIACHFLNHLNPTELSDEVLQTEISEDKKNLAQIFHCNVVGCAYPYGAYEQRTKDFLAKNDIKYCRTVNSTHSFEMPKDLLELHPTCHHNDEMLFELAEKFLSAKDEGEDLLFYIWGHSYEFDSDDNWDRMEKLCKMLAGRDDIVYCTNREVFGF